jgi:sulfite reductase alpha subunit-like flavoprotein
MWTNDRYFHLRILHLATLLVLTNSERSCQHHPMQSITRLSFESKKRSQRNATKQRTTFSKREANKESNETPQNKDRQQQQQGLSHFNYIQVFKHIKMTSSSFTSCQILWSTQSGRAKACARRTARILREQTNLEVKDIGSSFDETSKPFLKLVSNLPSDTFLLLFVSTTGDGEHCDSIRDTWKSLLQKSLPKTLLQGKQFALYCLGDRAYGPQFCAAGRKLAVRLLQLGMERYCEVGYGDDNTPNGGVFRDLDDWLEQHLLALLEKRSEGDSKELQHTADSPFQVQFLEEALETASDQEAWQNPRFEQAFRGYFALSCPVTAYDYNSQTQRLVQQPQKKVKTPPLLGTVLVNKRITAPDWEQNTRHIQLRLQSTAKEAESSSSSQVSTLPYRAGDIATILSFNSDQEVEHFLSVLPESVRSIADHPLHITLDESLVNNSHTRWPSHCTLRFLLKYCADIHALPEREDLRALSCYSSLEHEAGARQSEKLRSLCETSEAALYADYILREKRSWADVLYDFESLTALGSRLTLEALLLLLPPIRPRDFSIASAPTSSVVSSTNGAGTDKNGFTLELCVAVVQGRTRLGRSYHGLCSEYLSRMVPHSETSTSPPLLQVWIRQGTFAGLPMELTPETKSFSVPVLCVGAGTGIAPLRALLLERDAVRTIACSDDNSFSALDENENILVFGCRKQACDYYYKDEWQQMSAERRVRVLTAFSQDQIHKIYVQKVLREADGGRLIAKHILEKMGALYIAGGPKMARAVKEEVVEALGKELQGGEKQANQVLNKLQRIGKFSIEAWS